MQELAQIAHFSKTFYRRFQQELLKALEKKGFLDLRPSFIELLLYLAENPKSKIKDIGESVDLKKQTMTSHLNELEKRGYITRTPGLVDKREILIELTEYGNRFKHQLLEVLTLTQRRYKDILGEVEFDRLLNSSKISYEKLKF